MSDTWLAQTVKDALEGIGKQPETLARWVVSDFRRMRANVIGAVGACARMDGRDHPTDEQIEAALWNALREIVGVQ